MDAPAETNRTLQDLDLKGYGRFDADHQAGFIIETLNLPGPWEYIYENGRIMLKVDQYGPVSAQLDPPRDVVLFRREQYQRYSSWLVWLRSPQFEGKGFTNFFRPLLCGDHPTLEPDRVEIRFRPSEATYLIEHEGVRCVTEICVPSETPAVLMKVSLTNQRNEILDLSITSALRTYANPAMLAPWDKPEWYLKTGFCLSEMAGFWSHLLNMNSEFEKRRAMVLWSDAEDLIGAEISHEKFIGQGTFENPQSVFDGKLRLSPGDGTGWGSCTEKNTLYGFPPVNALQYRYEIAPGDTKTLHQVLAMLPTGPRGSLPDEKTARSVWCFLDDKVVESERKKLRERFEQLAGTRQIESPDKCLNRYVNEWLPLQLAWVCSLDRGWPTGMRGTRDSANDFTALVPLDPARSWAIIETILSCQRTDGWFPRQYSVSGRKGTHDLRNYVDAGCVVIELLYEYLCYSKDTDSLDRRLAWLDSDSENTVLEHALKSIEFYISDANLGEHGLCKIGEGDWLDAVNRAGVKGRGESVTVTNQVIVALNQMSSILEHLRSNSRIPEEKTVALLAFYTEKKNELARNLRRHALNEEGYFNSVFNDDGQWLFSNKDSDGVHRVYGPANWYSIISGVAVPDLVDSVLKELQFLKCPAGYRLFWPPMGEPPIDKVGRIGTGDVPPGLNENATPYNHGAHGFLGRALAVAGKGDLLYEVLQYMLPYDQEKHPITETVTPPYAVVNTWNQVPVFPHRGGMTFLTGSIAYAIRLVHSWMLGVRPTLDGLAIDPCIPSTFGELRAAFRYLGMNVELEIRNPDRNQCGVRAIAMNGQEIIRKNPDPFSQRTVFTVPDLCFRPENNSIVATL